MFNVLEFVMVACLFSELLVVRGAQLVTWLKGAEATVVTDVKKL